jgi:hypothetical protein
MAHSRLMHTPIVVPAWYLHIMRMKEDQRKRLLTDCAGPHDTTFEGLEQFTLYKLIRQ